MYKTLRHAVLLLGPLVFILCVVLLLNFTHPNPTGRRYSSEAPLTTRQGTSGEIGEAGERLLAKELGLPRNESPDQRQCFCGDASRRTTPSLSECRVCISYIQMASPFRRPDFVSPNFIAESKNTQSLLYTGRELDQIGDYALNAKALGIPLWVYTRVNTNVDPEFYRIVESTGGGVVQYFTVSGYIDPVDQVASSVMLLSLLAVTLAIILEMVARRPARPVSAPAPSPSPDADDDAEDFLRKARERLNRDIDTANLRDNMD
jgi:hypothetical protein